LIPTYKTTDPEETYDAVKTVAKVLISKQAVIIPLYLKHLSQRTNTQFKSTPDSKDLISELYQLAQQLKGSGNSQIQDLIALIIKLATFLKDPQDIDKFVSCSGVGLQFLVLDAQDDLIQDIEFDCRGEVVILPKNFAKVEVGEINSSSNGLSYADKQVILKCKVIESMIKILFTDITKITLMGTIFYGGKRQSQQNEDIDSGVSIYYFNFT